MAFKSLNYVLGSLESRYQPQEQKQLRLVIGCWASVVGPVVAAQAQPIAIQRGVLRVATASSAWAQNLVFERQRILEKLNQRVQLALTDIRFSTAQWQQSSLATTFPGQEQQREFWQQHPCRLERYVEPSKPLSADEIDPLTAFRHWADRVRSQSSHLPLCPHCHCPTPPGELDRWKVCAVCAAQRW